MIAGSGRGIRHYFARVLAISMAAILSGARSYTAIAEWAEKLTQKQRERLRAQIHPEIIYSMRGPPREDY